MRQVVQSTDLQVMERVQLLLAQRIVPQLRVSISLVVLRTQVVGYRLWG
jgi:hypothetical protein